MRPTRRQFLIATAGLGAAACAPTAGPAQPPIGCAAPAIGGPAPLPPPGALGLLDEALFQSRVGEYLTLATQSLQPTNSASVVAHLVRAARDASFAWDPTQVTTALVGTDPFKDTGDFDLMSYQWVLRLGRGVLPAATIGAIEDAIAGARYRYDDPLPSGEIDNKWFWSENHRIIFAVDEYLGGLALPDRTFTFTGLTGAEHAARSRQRIVDWISERAHFGFAEWHSNTYMKYDYSPLLTLVEFAEDVDIVSLAAGALDVAMFDVAAHTLHGAYGVTHGRAYKGPKTNSLVETSFGTTKMLFGTTDRPYQSLTDIGPTFFAASGRYRLPAAVYNVGTSTETATIRERHGVALDPHEEFSLDPVAPYGYRYDDPANLPFWWSQGALTAWQMIPLSLQTAEKYHLFDTELFQKFKAVQQFTALGPTILEIAARELSGFAAAGVLGEAHTYTWRSADAMLSSVVDHRFGDAVEQAHAWQATLGPEAMVFTTHPTNGVPQSLDWSNDDGYWTGSASMPRTAQRDRAAIHIYRPSYASPTDPILGPVFSYEPYTHAFFPQDRMDEVVTQNGWYFGRSGDGYVALLSERPAQWRVYDTATEATGGHTLPFDLVASGGADNVWLVEVGTRAEHGSFAAFVAAVSGATVEFVRTGPEIAARFVSPTAGDLRFSTTGSFSVDGIDTPLRDHPRHSSPWADQCALGVGFDISAGGARVRIDSGTGGREVG